MVPEGRCLFVVVVVVVVCVCVCFVTHCGVVAGNKIC